MSTQSSADEHDAIIDAVCDKIDEAIPRLRERERSGKTPTNGFKPGHVQQVRKVFQQMHEDPVLTRSGEDIRLSNEELAESARETKEAEAAHRARSKSGSRLRIGLGSPTPPPPTATPA